MGKPWMRRLYLYFWLKLQKRGLYVSIPAAAAWPCSRLLLLCPLSCSPSPPPCFELGGEGGRDLRFFLTYPPLAIRLFPTPTYTTACSFHISITAYYRVEVYRINDEIQLFLSYFHCRWTIIFPLHLIHLKGVSTSSISSPSFLNSFYISFCNSPSRSFIVLIAPAKSFPAL